jgi:hypothetical protein
MDLASVKSFFSYECQNSTDIKYGSVSEKLDSVATRWPPTTADCEDKAIVIQELSSSKHNTPTERAGGLNVDENTKCSSAIHKAKQLAVPRTTSCKSEAGNSCQQCTIRYVTDGSNHLNVSSWRQHISQTSTGQIGAPNVDANCTDGNNTAGAEAMRKARGNTRMLDHFKSPANDALFGSVRIQHEGDNRDLLLPATAIANFTDDSVDQMMLWATGEYASMQDRRIYDNTTNANPFSEYNKTGVEADSDTFLTKKAYYVFNKDINNVERNTILVTQPMKGPLVQLGDTNGYWDNEGTAVSPWGDFKLQYRLYDDNEKEYAEEAGLQHITSPYNTDPAAGYINELQVLRDLEEDTDIVKGTNGEYFNNGTNGYADINFFGNRNTGLPAIITQMSSSKVGNESQINWVYSTTVK